jgi:two-component system sensor histidine kinase KdpD
MTEARPNPDLLLTEVKKQEAKAQRGKLKVFFGMAAGVGKTYAMLEEARARAAEGLDVLIGYAEPHIRTDTEALLLGMEILPYQIVEYRNAKLKELDLDAALNRHPALICVDELAHSNAPGMRHPKRWQDVLELLDAGINVYTTLNVQHLESINDIVERVTGVKVRETLPDLALEQADEVELVDIAPEELLERFQEGKVYRPEQAERAARHFFTKGNLIALRELALRQTAQRVDAQMDDFRRDNAVRATWPATERILVCVSPSPLSARLVRAAKRLAAGLKATWIAAYVETPKPINAADRLRVEQNLHLAEQLGAETVTLSGERVSEELIAYAGTRNVTKIVIGKPVRSRWRDMLFGSVVDDLVRKSGEVDIYVIRGGAEESETPAAPVVAAPAKYDWRGYAWATALAAVVTAIGWPLYHGFHVPDETRTPFLANTNVLVLYLLAVLWIANRHSRSAAILASVLGVALFDFCFVPPYLTFTVSDQQYIVTFAAMLVTALLISTLTHRVRAQAEAARDRERRTAAMFSLNRDLATARGTDEVASMTVKHTADVFGTRVLLLLSDADRRLLPRAASNGEPVMEPKEMGVAQWSFEHDQPAGAGTNTLPAAQGMYLPLKSSRGVLGVIGIFGENGHPSFGPERRQLVEAFASQSGLALERAALAEEARLAWERVEVEFLRNTLLSGVSHELRTPLAAITGLTSTLIDSGESLPPESRAELLDTIFSEAERMERLVTNLLDMTRLESGGLTLKREWQPIQEVVGSALHHMDRRLRQHAVTTDLPADLPLVQIDGVAIEQVLVNLIDNAVEYTPPDAPIDIRAGVGEGGLTVEVADRGPGLHPGTEGRIFDKFFRASPPVPSAPGIPNDQAALPGRRGVGLGLAICRGIIHAHGGTISASNRTDGGALFRFTLPLTEEPPQVDSSG